MKTWRRMAIAVGSLAVMIGTTGCASKEVVKKDESLGSKTTVAKPTAVSPTKAVENPQKENKSKQSPPVTAEAPKQLEQQQTKATAVKTDLEKIYFDFNSSGLSEAARQALTKDAETLVKLNNPKVTIEGHCDERGSAEYNLALGERRARAAKQYLSTLGVPAEKVAVISYGKEKPAVDGHDESAWAKNRRDELIIQK